MSELKSSKCLEKYCLGAKTIFFFFFLSYAKKSARKNGKITKF